MQQTSARRSGESERARDGQALDALVRRYAPLLRFSSDETHFPIEPARFVSRAVLRRYGWGPPAPDAYWNRAARRWETAPLGRLVQADLVAPDVADAVRAMDQEAPVPAGSRANRRPLDADNLWGGGRSGYAFELLEPLARDIRGGAGDPAPLFYDHRVLGTPAGEQHVIGYWFFYALDLAKVAHEGDWECVRVVLGPDGAGPQVWCGRGPAERRLALAEFETVDGHPVVYVEQGSHEAFPRPELMDQGAGGRYSLAAQTWQAPLRHVGEEAWAAFDGAWGLVGTSEAGTGPLGPG